jgi:putative DNA-invertase from lambdoid prophage Rac
MKAFGYIFLTMDRTNQVAVAEQQRAIQAYGKSRGLAVDDFFVEQGYSMKSAFRERKEGGRLLAGLKTGDAVIVMKAEWVLGSAKEAIRLLQALNEMSVPFYCVDLNENISTAAERKLAVSEGGASLVMAVLTSLAACEESRQGETIKSAKRHQKKEGKYMGGPVPFGWQVEREYLVQNPKEQEIIQEILQLRLDRWSYRDIAGKLQEGHGIRLSHEGVRRILASNSKKKEEEKKRTRTGK